MRAKNWQSNQHVMGFPAYGGGEKSGYADAYLVRQIDNGLVSDRPPLPSRQLNYYDIL